MIFFPADSLERAQIERDYQTEFEAAQNAGFSTQIFDFDGLIRGENLASVLRRVRDAETPTPALYRGWMLSPENYENLARGLADKGFVLVNSPQNYRFAHFLPENYEFLRDFTPQTRWIERSKFERGENYDFAPIFEAVAEFGDAPLIVKDWVKSQKHRWHEACFIPRASDLEAVERVARRFLELQGDFLAEGLVFREFVELRKVGAHAQSQMPLTAEWRAFFFDGELILAAPYWDGDYSELELDLAPFRKLARALPSRFFTLDVAQKADGAWIVVEMGDGGVSGLPRADLADEFYRGLRARFSYLPHARDSGRSLSD